MILSHSICLPRAWTLSYRSRDAVPLHTSQRHDVCDLAELVFDSLYSTLLLYLSPDVSLSLCFSSNRNQLNQVSLLLHSSNVPLCLRLCVHPHIPVLNILRVSLTAEISVSKCRPIHFLLHLKTASLCVPLSFFVYTNLKCLRATRSECFFVQVGCGGATVDYLAAVVAYPEPDDKIRTTSLKVKVY